MLACGKFRYLKHLLLGLARTGRRQVYRDAGLSVNLNLDLAGARFLRRDDRHAASGERTAPDIARRFAGGEIVVEIAGAQVAAANPSDCHRARIVVVEPALVMGDAQHAAPPSQAPDW